MTSSIYTADARFVLTGSDDGNVRIWKARASDKLGIITTREKAAMEYRDSLRARWNMDPEVIGVEEANEILNDTPNVAKGYAELKVRSRPPDTGRDN